MVSIRKRDPKVKMTIHSLAERKGPSALLKPIALVRAEAALQV